MTRRKEYLGDGAYADFDGYAVWPTTENGIETTNKVCLEPSVLRAFERYVAQIRGERKEKPENQEDQ